MTRHVTDDEQGAEHYERNIRNAARTCKQCAECGRALAANAPVWRARLPLGWGRPGRPGVHPGMRYAIAPVCARCKPRGGFLFLPAQPCITCGRPVHDDDTLLARKWTICCEACARVARLAAARQRRSEARGTRKCDICGETFEPTRTDARFCSSICRQRAYRRRKAVTDDDIDAGCVEVTSRNGSAPVTDRETVTGCPFPISRNGR
jgi:hypothetical protein